MNMQPAPITLLATAFATFASASSMPAATPSNGLPPATKTAPVTDTLHGVEIVDEYRWLEPLEKESSEVTEWTTAQNDYTRSVLEALPCREDLSKALEPWMTLGAVGAPRMADSGYFYSERTGTQNQAVVKFRATLASADSSAYWKAEKRASQSAMRKATKAAAPMPPAKLSKPSASTMRPVFLPAAASAA